MGQSRRKIAKRKLRDIELALSPRGGNSRRVVRYLRSRGEVTALELMHKLRMTQPQVSHQITRLRNAGLIETTVKGRYHRYRWLHDKEKELLEFIGAW